MIGMFSPDRPMSDKQEKQTGEISDKYKPIYSGGTCRGVDPENPCRTRDPANKKRHNPQNQVAEGADFDVFE